MPSRLPQDLRRRLEPIRLLVLDVDGVLTDGRLYFTAEGEAMKVFHVRDGLGLRLLMDHGIQVALITGRSCPAVDVRARGLSLDPELVIQGSRGKGADLDRVLERSGLADHQVAAMGDDLPDLPILRRAGFAACPADAAPEVVAHCHHVCGADGGHGAVRELAELLLKGQGAWSGAVDRWVGEGGAP